MYKVFHPYGRLLLETESLNAAIEFANEYAAKHGMDICIEDDNVDIVYETWLGYVEA